MLRPLLLFPETLKLPLLQMLGRVMGLGLFASRLLLVRGQEGSSNVTCLADYDWVRTFRF